MACVKYIKWLFIPVFAILLMSHNSYALSYNGVYHPAYVVNNTSMVYYSLYPNEGWVDQKAMNNNGGVSFAIPADSIQVRNVNRFVLNLNANLKNSLITIPYRVCFNYVPDAAAWIGFGSASQSAIVSNDFTFESSSCLAGHVVIYSGTSNAYNIFLGGYDNGSVIGAFNNGFSIVFGMPSGIYLSDDADYTSVLNAIKNNTDDIKSKLDDLEEAAQTQQEAAEKDLQGVENIENQSADDYEMESANMSSLFSQFGGFITAVQGAHVGDCNIPANLNHINLGILNLCDNPVPDYAQVAVSIIVCMLIAPYLLNIIKRIIGIADKVREV